MYSNVTTDNHYLVLVGKVSNEAVRVVVLLVVERVKIREV